MTHEWETSSTGMWHLVQSSRHEALCTSGAMNRPLRLSGRVVKLNGKPEGRVCKQCETIYDAREDEEARIEAYAERLLAEGEERANRIEPDTEGM